MANTANTQEPTMEEILASIRRIISEDGEENAETKAKPGPAVAAAKVAPKPVAAASVAAPERVEDDEEILELTDVVPEEDDEPAPALQKMASDDDVVMVERAPMKSSPKASAAMVSRPRPTEDKSLISDTVREQASTSFMALARNTLVSETTDPRSLEMLVQEMLHPMLEGWLNENLPSIVERLVQQEIDRVSRKTR